MNLKMVDFKRCLETAGYSNVKTVLSSGNAAFDTSSKSAAVIERQIEATFAEQLGRSFYTIVRSVKQLQDMIESDPYSQFALPSNAKRVIEATFTKQLGRSFYTIVRSVVRGFLLLIFLAASAASGKNGSTATANDRAVAIAEAVKLSPNPCN